VLHGTERCDAPAFLRVIRITLVIVQLGLDIKSAKWLQDRTGKKVTSIHPVDRRNSRAIVSVVLGGLRPRARTWALLVGTFSASCAMAAGGHHAVDDAAILDDGLCKLEGWLAGGRDSERLVHAGGGCRVGPVELNAAGEHTRADGGSESSSGLQMKWATEVAPGFSAGLSLAASWQSHVRPRHQTDTLVTLFTWALRDDLALHVNLGRDFNHADADQNRGGVSAEWRVQPNWSVVAERYLDTGTHFLRAGVRRAVTEGWSIDLSRAHRLRGPAGSNWTLGTTWQFERP
jgi:hypothetical protein